MSIRDKYEYLKSELMVALTDATVMCNLDLPFDFKISQEEEERYFVRGMQTRLATKKSMIILDNTYKKVRLFPSDESVKLFTDARDEILLDYKKDVTKAYEAEAWRFPQDNAESFEKYIDDLIVRIKAATEPYIKALKDLKPEDIEKEIKAEDKLRKSTQQTVLQKNNDNPKGLF